ncbi:hypothetical protein [Chryseosolibacter indicus]|uniref:Uncharacterized protein n=1 Tax=Chryseosolibacter indicus TaxID=2782351 RepID=A0ABS5VYF0_9BACT|nr:hypothetical protein [Chryseosolibacter indicus]MBT1705890.1 hypothetical protein [Chryseosolibacter indicus]
MLQPHKARALPAFMSGQRAWYLIIGLAKESNIRKAQALTSSPSFPACNRDYEKLKEAARNSPDLAIGTMKMLLFKVLF